MSARDFVEWLEAPEFHWFFVQGEQALEQGLYLPGTVSLLNGVEASVRVTIHQLDGREMDDPLGATLSNALLLSAGSRGLPVSSLAFPVEANFAEKLRGKERVEIVRLRNNLAHGNTIEFADRESNFFTPECMRDVSAQILDVARVWARLLGVFRAAHLSTAPQR